MAGRNPVQPTPVSDVRTLNGETVGRMSRGLSCTIDEMFNLLSSPMGLGLCMDDPNLSVFGNEMNKCYVLDILCDANQALIRALDINTIQFCNEPLTWDPEAKQTSGVNDAKVKKGVHVWIATKKHSGTDKAKQFLCYAVRNTFGWKDIPESGAFTLEELQVRFKEETLALEAKIREVDADTSGPGVCGMELKMPNVSAGLLSQLIVEPFVQQTICKMLRERGALYSFESNYSLAEHAISVRLDCIQFTEALSYTAWENQLTPYTGKLFHISTCLGARTSLPLLQYFQLMSWLGHPSLTAKQTIPVQIAIDLYFQILTKNITAQNIFCGFVSRALLDQLSERDRKSLGPIMRFNDGRLSFDEKNEKMYFHRNLVLTNYENKAECHQLMFMFDATTGMIKEADESWKTRFMYRKTQPKRDSRELDIDFRQILTAFNTALRPGTASDAPTLSPSLADLLGEYLAAVICIAECVQPAPQPTAGPGLFGSYGVAGHMGFGAGPAPVSLYGGIKPLPPSGFRQIPSGRAPGAPGFDPKRGNRI